MNKQNTTNNNEKETRFIVKSIFDNLDNRIRTMRDFPNEELATDYFEYLKKLNVPDGAKDGLEYEIFGTHAFGVIREYELQSRSIYCRIELFKIK